MRVGSGTLPELGRRRLVAIDVRWRARPGAVHREGRDHHLGVGQHSLLCGQERRSAGRPGTVTRRSGTQRSPAAAQGQARARRRGHRTQLARGVCRARRQAGRPGTCARRGQRGDGDEPNHPTRPTRRKEMPPMSMSHGRGRPHQWQAGVPGTGRALPVRGRLPQRPPMVFSQPMSRARLVVLLALVAPLAAGAQSPDLPIFDTHPLQAAATGPSTRPSAILASSTRRGSSAPSCRARPTTGRSRSTGGLAADRADPPALSHARGHRPLVARRSIAALPRGSPPARVHRGSRVPSLRGQTGPPWSSRSWSWRCGTASTCTPIRTIWPSSSCSRSSRGSRSFWAHAGMTSGPRRSVPSSTGPHPLGRPRHPHGDVAPSACSTRAGARSSCASDRFLAGTTLGHSRWEPCPAR